MSSAVSICKFQQLTMQQVTCNNNRNPPLGHFVQCCELTAMTDVSAESFALVSKGCTFHNSRRVHNSDKYSLSEVLDEKRQRV
jgi:hypothetical protein